MNVSSRAALTVVGGLAAGITAGVAFGGGDERPNPGTSLVMAGMGTGFTIYGLRHGAAATDGVTRAINGAGAFTGAALVGAAITTLVRGGTNPTPEVPTAPGLPMPVPTGTTVGPLTIPGNDVPGLATPSPMPGPAPTAPLDVDALLRGQAPAGGGGTGASW